LIAEKKITFNRSRPFASDQCDAAFRTKVALETHVNWQHSDLKINKQNERQIISKLSLWRSRGQLEDAYEHKAQTV